MGLGLFTVSAVDGGHAGTGSGYLFVGSPFMECCEEYEGEIV